MITLVGSKAAQHWHPAIWTHCNDTDYIATLEDFLQWYDERKSLIKGCFPFDKGKKYFVKYHSEEIVEFEIAHPGSSGEQFLELVDGIEKDGELIPTMDWLFALKSSHKYLKDSPHFEKTMKDYHFMKYVLGCEIPNKEWFRFREKETYENQNMPKLNQSKKDFFSGDGLEYIYVHDDLHEAVKIGEKPAYKYYIKDNEEVMTSKKKWNECSEEIKLNGVLEEAYVLSLERAIIPYGDQIKPYEAFKIALSKISTSICGGYFREYAYENYYTALKNYSDDFMKNFKKGLENGTIKKI